MTSTVVTVEETTPYKEIVARLAEHAVSALPVITPDRRVVGVVSEADLLRKLEYTGREPPAHPLVRWHRRAARAKAAADVAADLMTSPAVVITPVAPLTAAARLMDAQRVKRLPVVDGNGRLVGILARRDLLRVYLREDDAIRAEIRADVLHRTLGMDPDAVTVTVDGGVVTLGGTVDRRSTVPLIEHLVERIPGVVDVVDDLTYHYDDARRPAQCP
jgi:CBS domain-containing protein